MERLCGVKKEGNLCSVCTTNLDLAMEITSTLSEEGITGFSTHERGIYKIFFVQGEEHDPEQLSKFYQIPEVVERLEKKYS